MAIYQHTDNKQKREMSKEAHKNLPSHLQKKWNEIPSTKKKAPAKKAEQPAEADEGEKS